MAAIGFRGCERGADNFAPLSAMTWQVHVYGSGEARARQMVR